MKNVIRENAIQRLYSPGAPDSELAQKFGSFLECYCVELKQTEDDVLLDDQHFEMVWDIFSYISDRSTIPLD